MDQRLSTSSLCYSVSDKHLIKEISLEFPSGFLHGILGPNGSGKSTLLKTISGIWKPTSGKIFWNQESLQGKDRQAISRIISLVPQNPTPVFDYLVEDVVSMGRYPYEKYYWNSSQRMLIYHALNVVDAWHLRSRCVNHLSQGERQRVYIARALVSESPVLLLDEPTASLDIQHQLEILQLLQKLVKDGKIIIVTMHDLSLAERFCNQIAVLNHGACIGTGTFPSLMTPSLLKDVFGVSHSSHSFQKHYEAMKNATYATD